MKALCIQPSLSHKYTVITWMTSLPRGGCTYYFMVHTPYTQLIAWCTECRCSRVKHLYFSAKVRAASEVCMVPWYFSSRVQLVVKEVSDHFLQSLETEMLCNMRDKPRHTIHCTKCMSVAVA